MSDIVGVNEIAAEFNVKPGTVHQWRKRTYLNFPEPAGHVSGTPYWYRETIKDWAIKVGRRF